MIKFTPIDIDVETRELEMINWKLMEYSKKLIHKDDFTKAKFKGIVNEFKEAYPEREVIEATLFEVRQNKDYYRLIGEIKSKIK